MTLLQTQIAFARLVPNLIKYCFDNDYEVVIEEVYRPPETVRLFALEGRGSRGSLHPDKLAIDLSLFINGQLLTHTESYQTAGQYWENLSTEEVCCCWGGRFKRADGNHFSVQWQDRR